MKLEKAIKFKNGKKRSSEIGNIPVYGGNGILGYTNNYNAEKDNIIIGRVGAYCGCVYKNDDKCWISDNAIVGNVREGYDYNFMYYLLKNKNLNSLHIGSSHPLMTQDILNNIDVNIPEYDYQKRAAKILNKIDKKIEINNQINDNLLKLCNSVFHYYLDENKDSLSYKKIIDIADRVVTGKTPSTKNKELWKEEIPFITIPDMHNQIYTIETERKISRAGATSIIPKDSISVSCIATVGLVSINVEESQTNQQINSVVMKNEYDLFYLFEYLSEQEEFMKNIAGGSTTYNINKNMFENIEIPYIPVEKVKEFHNIVKNMFQQVKENQIENKYLEELRDTLLPRLMNGEIDLDKIEI